MDVGVCVCVWMLGCVCVCGCWGVGWFGDGCFEVVLFVRWMFRSCSVWVLDILETQTSISHMQF